VAKRHLSAKQIAAGFGGKAAKRGVRRARKSTVAKKSRKSPSRARRRSLGSIRQRVHVGTLGWSAVAGAAAPYAGQVVGPFGPGLAIAAAGVASGNDALQAIGGLSLGGAAIRAVTQGSAIAPTGSARIL
jgi:hypothetical protein